MIFLCSLYFFMNISFNVVMVTVVILGAINQNVISLDFCCGFSTKLLATVQTNQSSLFWNVLESTKHTQNYFRDAYH